MTLDMPGYVIRIDPAQMGERAMLNCEQIIAARAQSVSHTRCQ
jgi:hypothetical protein